MGSSWGRRYRRTIRRARQGERGGNRYRGRSLSRVWTKTRVSSFPFTSLFLSTLTWSRFASNSCCGTHYPSLSPLSFLFLSPYTTSIRSTNSRIYFAFGHRAHTFLSSSFQSARNAALSIGCSVSDLPEKTKEVLSRETDGKRREKKVKEELAGWVAKDVVQRAEKDGYVALLREDDATNELTFLTAVAAEATSLFSSSSLDSTPLILLASGAIPGSPTASTAGGTVLIFGGSDALVLTAGKAVVEAFGKERVKGGGKGRWQGKVSGRWEQGDEVLLRKVVREVVEGAKAS